MANQDVYSVSVECPLPGFEKVAVIYSMMATQEQLEIFSRKNGGEGSHEEVVLHVDGWDEDKYGKDPWSASASPMAFRVWAAKRGWARAMIEFASDPNL